MPKEENPEPVVTTLEAADASAEGEEEKAPRRSYKSPDGEQTRYTATDVLTGEQVDVAFTRQGNYSTTDPAEQRVLEGVFGLKGKEG